jgi:phage terminase small subunit
MIRARPEVAMLSDAMRQAQSLIGELMLNPSAALRLASGHKPQPGAFDDF